MKHTVWLVALAMGLGAAGPASAVGEAAVTCETSNIKVETKVSQMYWKLVAAGCKKGAALADKDMKWVEKVTKLADKFQEFVADTGTGCDPDEDYTIYNAAYHLTNWGFNPSGDALSPTSNFCNGSDDM